MMLVDALPLITAGAPLFSLINLTRLALLMLLQYVGSV